MRGRYIIYGGRLADAPAYWADVGGLRCAAPALRYGGGSGEQFFDWVKPVMDSRLEPVMTLFEKNPPGLS